MLLDPSAEELFHELLPLAVTERTLRLDRLYPDGGALRAEIESLLRAADARVSGFLAIPGGRAPIEPPSSFGKYRVAGELGRGGAGVVYLAEDPDLGRSVAIKILATRYGSIADRLRREGRSLAAVQHPNVAQVYTLESGPMVTGAGPDAEASSSEVTFLTLEYVPGDTLADRLRGGPMHLEEALECARQIGSAIEAAHKRRVLHRDLKPANIKITQDGWIKVLDFGLASMLAEARSDAESGDRRRAQRGSSPGGTPGYMSPEQCRNEDLDTRTDLWSFGAILYECLVGQPAIVGESMEGLFDANRCGEVDLDAIPSSVPARVRDLIRACLEVDRDRRSIDAVTARQVLDDELLRLRAGTFAGPALPPLGKKDDDAAGTQETGTRRGNLPIPLTRFVGRREILERLEPAIANDRLVTLTGPGGVGKTRTALQLGMRVAARFAAGTWFVDLAAIDPDADLVAAVARSLRIREVRPGGGDDLETMIASAFGEAAGLLILDNCEHVVERAAAFAAGVLARSEGLTILATSREPLGIPGEQVVPVVPFDVPEHEEAAQSVASSGPPFGSSPPSDAVDLFVLRARARSPRFDVSPDRVKLVRELCRRLDGLPLAIELAASQAGALSLEELHRRVLEGLPLAPAGATGRSSRHRSIRDLVEWSYRLLSPEGRILFRRLSIFRGGWTMADAEAVCSGDGVDPWQVYELLATLLDKSLLQVREDTAGQRPSGKGVATRYHFLETIRVFAAEKLRESEGEQERLYDTYLRHMLATTDLRPGEHGATRAAWVRRVEPDYANALHAIDLALARGAPEMAASLAARLGPYWMQMGFWSEGMRWIDRILAARGSRRGVTGPMDRDGGGMPADPRPREEILFLNQAARLASMTVAPRRAVGFVGEALRLAESLGDPGLLAQTLVTAGVCAWFRTDLDAAAPYYERARTMHEQLGDKAGLAVCIANLAAVHSARGAHETALPLHEEHRRLARELGDGLAESKSLLNLARTALILGRTTLARQQLAEALPILRDHRDLHSVAQALHSLGDVDLKEGRLEGARANLLESARLRIKIGDTAGVSSVLGSLARAEAAGGDPRIAAALLAAVVDAYRSGRIPALSTQIEDASAALEETRAKLPADLAARWEERGRQLDFTGLIDLAAGEAAEEPA